ncbi:diguanylate cyclase (GGDEF) domain-containing protein [Rhizobiales bacterium GAS188]|nr:diguanylate cyclase (GGDEF) domain-containing protein [Rhizobiales bacterium GAS188]
MLTVYNCLVAAHDLRMVALAALICALASYTAINLLNHVRRLGDGTQDLWLCVAAVSTGFGIWATHFVAMLAFIPGIPNGYDFSLTALSLISAIILTGVGLACAAASVIPGGRWIGGAIVGAGIATMHYVGMAAFEIAGRITWDPTLVAASILLGGALGALSLKVGLTNGSVRSKLAGALLLTLAICSHHFTAMGAAAIIPDPTVRVPETALPTDWLAVGVTLASLTILLLTFAGLALDIHERHRAQREADRMRGLADAAVEGLLVCDGETIVTVNNSLGNLVGHLPEELVGAQLSSCIPDEAARRKLIEHPNVPIEAALKHAGSDPIAAEFILRPIDFAGKPHYAIAVRDLRDRRRAEEHIHFLAHHDALTGLPNRSAFNERLDREIEAHAASGRRLAVLCLDLDRFKEVNDLFGHGAGDALLKKVAKTITAILADEQMVARLGGDEFAIVAPDLTDAMTAGRIGECIIESLRAQNETSTTSALISTSIGIAIFPDNARDRRTLLTHADTAMYRAKTDGRGVYRFFEASMGVQVRDRRMLEHDLRNAVARKQLRLVYQPQTRVDSGDVVAFEALLRWNHPERGEVSPGVFIPVAEESGIILQIGEWALRAACSEAASWTTQLGIAVNVSAVQLHSPHFPQLVHEILFQTGLSPQRLELEITETALIRDLNRALSTLRLLKALGVRIAMDDFGTGYSSLSNLRAFPFDKIKIDGSFIKSVDLNEEAATIVRAVLGLGRGLNLPVLAEGVETSGELQFLNMEACSEAQGYLLGRPGPIDRFSGLVDGSNTPADASDGDEAAEAEPLKAAG